MFFIYDANGQLFGNPKGYKLHKSALSICTRYRHKLWTIYDTRSNTDSNVLYHIELTQNHET